MASSAWCQAARGTGCGSGYVRQNAGVRPHHSSFQTTLVDVSGVLAELH